MLAKKIIGYIWIDDKIFNLLKGISDVIQSMLSAIVHLEDLCPTLC